MSSLLELHKLTKTYGKQTAVQEVSFSIKKGEICGLVGENGAGKTTLLRILSGLIAPTSGTFTKAQNYRVGALIESPALQPNLSAVANLRYMAFQLGLDNSDERISETLDIVGLKDVDPKKKSKDFSLGMCQRLAIALAILDKPGFLILDEPINGLDPVGIKEMRHIILSLRDNYNMTILISSHILSELELVVDRYIIMHKGVVIRELSKANLQKQLEEQLYLKTSHHEKTLYLLEQENIPHTDEKESIILPAHTDVMEIVHLLIANQIDLKEIFKQQISFEDYYLTLITQGD